MKKHGYSKDEKLIYIDKVINDLITEKYKKVTNKEFKDRFRDYGISLTDMEIKALDVRKKLIENSITPTNLSIQEKDIYINKFLEYLIEKKTKYISDAEIIKNLLELHSVIITKKNITKLTIRKRLEDKGIEEQKTLTTPAKNIINKTIEYLLENDIIVKTVADFHKHTEQFGNISRGSIDRNLDYIQKKVDIKNIKSTKRLRALNLSDKEIIIEVAKYYTKKHIHMITAAEIRRFTNSTYRTVDIEVIREYTGFLQENYDIEIVGKNTHVDENVKQSVAETVAYLKKFKRRYSVLEIDSIDEVNDIDNSFMVDKTIKTDLEKEWELYINDYIIWLAKSRINVRNGLLNMSNELKIDTEKKKVLTLKHQDLDIKKMNVSDMILLSEHKTRSSDKSYGIHIQNMHISFLLFLHSKNKIILPFSYLYDVCFSNKKVQVELPYYLANHSINNAMLRGIRENRLNVKDDKYKRIFQFFLLSLPKNFSIKKIEYKHLVPLLNRNKNDFKRVSEILNTLGANIVVEKPRLKYVDRYIEYTKREKYKKLVAIFNKSMNRTYKLGSYTQEKSVYKDWSISYADFFDFLESNYQNENLSESFLYKIFDYPDEENILTYQEYIQSLKASQSTKDRKFTPLVVAFSENSLYRSLNNLKDKKPIFDNTSENNNIRKNRGAIKNFIALEKIEDILRNRPPKSDYYKILKIDSKYTDWWSNYDIVAPFEPLILLMHLYIPARGINFRLADRNSFLVKNESGNVTGYHFTHDKNKKRKTPYVAPNIWGDDLKIIENFIEYSQVHFPNQKAIKYDKQNPHGIVPLFPKAKGTNFYTESQHMSYWKRVLLKAQIEINNEDNDEKIILIYKKNSEVEIPKKPEDVDTLSQGYMENFDVRYDLHSLRHTGASRYANAGMPLGLLKLLTGHIDLNVLQSVYIEIDEERMIKEWEKLQDTNLDNLNLKEAGSKLITDLKKVTKEILSENNPKQLLKILEDNKFITIGSYLSNDKLTIYEMEDFSKIDPVFWTFKSTGICTSSICPQGLENRCSLCPHFLTSPAYMHEISAQVNLQNYRVSKYINMIKENRKNGNNENNMSIRTSAQLELEEMLGWTEILKALDEIRTVTQNEQNKGDKYSPVDTTISTKSLFGLAPIKNSDHSLLKLVYDGLALKQFDHESMQDASEKLVTKLIKYAARNGKFPEIDGKDKYEIFEWFKPIYDEVLLLEKDRFSQEKLSNILSFISDKPSVNLLEKSNIKQLTHKEDE